MARGFARLKEQPLLELPLYQVDAFAERPFEGNPAAVVPLAYWLPDAVLQAMAAEHNLSETAFFVPESDGCYHLRWFTPAAEVEMCGHATLATAHVLTTIMGERGTLRFRTLSGELRVERDGPRYVLDFPILPVRPVRSPPGLVEALGVAPVEVWRGRDWLCLLPDAQAVRALKPNDAALAALSDAAQAPDGTPLDIAGVPRVIVTAAGEAGSPYDCVSRFFAIKVGVAEDPVTGTAHTQLVPFWAQRLGRDELVCRQASLRGGTLWCRLAGGRVRMAGSAVLYARGTVLLEESFFSSPSSPSLPSTQNST